MSVSFQFGIWAYALDLFAVHKQRVLRVTPLAGGRWTDLDDHQTVQFAGIAYQLSLVALANAPLNGTQTNDILIGDDRANVINGLAGNDFLAGGGGNDKISGGKGQDWIVDFEGANAIDGGPGWDTLDFRRAPGSRSFLPFNFGISFSVPLQTYSTLSLNANLLYTINSSWRSIEQIFGSQFNDFISVGASVAAAFGAKGDDWFSLENETLTDEPVALFGGMGDDTYEFDLTRSGRADWTVTINDSAGHNRLFIHGVRRNDLTFTRSHRNGADLLIAVTKADHGGLIRVVNGWSAYQNGQLDLVFSEGETHQQSSYDPSRAATLLRSTLDEHLIGGTKNDVLSNDPGVFYRFYPDDFFDPLWRLTDDATCTMTGGAGADEFQIWSGCTITDFGNGLDRLVFSQSLFTNVDNVMHLKRTERNGNLLIDTGYYNAALGQHLTVTLNGVSEREFAAAYQAGRILVANLMSI